MEEIVTKFSSKFREIWVSSSHALLQGLNEGLPLPMRMKFDVEIAMSFNCY